MTEENVLKIVFDTKIFPVDALMGACHKFLAKCFIKLEYIGGNDREVQVALKPRQGMSLDGVEAEFQDEVMNYSMKNKVLKGTAKIRDQIFHIVFNPERLDALGGNLISEMQVKEDPESLKLNSRLEKLLEEIEGEEPLDYEEDPLGIAIPWEEKHGMPKDLLHPVDQMKRQSENDMVNPDMVKDIVKS